MSGVTGKRTDTGETPILPNQSEITKEKPIDNKDAIDKKDAASVSIEILSSKDKEIQNSPILAKIKDKFSEEPSNAALKEKVASAAEILHPEVKALPSPFAPPQPSVVPQSEQEVWQQLPQPSALQQSEQGVGEQQQWSTLSHPEQENEQNSVALPDQNLQGQQPQGFSDEQFAALTPEELNRLTPEQLDTLTLDQLELYDQKMEEFEKAKLNKSEQFSIISAQDNTIATEQEATVAQQSSMAEQREAQSLQDEGLSTAEVEQANLAQRMAQAVEGAIVSVGDSFTHISTLPSEIRNQIWKSLDKVIGLNYHTGVLTHPPGVGHLYKIGQEIKVNLPTGMISVKITQIIEMTKQEAEAFKEALKNLLTTLGLRDSAKPTEEAKEDTEAKRETSGKPDLARRMVEKDDRTEKDDTAQLLEDADKKKQDLERQLDQQAEQEHINKKAHEKVKEYQDNMMSEHKQTLEDSKDQKQADLKNRNV